MTSAIDQYKNAKTIIGEQHKIINSLREKVFKEVSRDLFAKHPNLESFSWRQYTPYFNDGDTCHFQWCIDECAVSLKGDDADDGGYYRKGDPRLSIRDDVVKVIQSYFNDDDVEALFGDHCRVTVSRDGGAETEEYSHD